jgi:hypothetical protein
MSARKAESGVCVVRVEVQAEHLLITVTTNLALDRNLYTARPDAERHFTDPDDAVRAVAEFLRSFTPPIGA